MRLNATFVCVEPNFTAFSDEEVGISVAFPVECARGTPGSQGQVGAVGL